VTSTFESASQRGVLELDLFVAYLTDLPLRDQSGR
jgi:hypothetical protein